MTPPDAVQPGLRELSKRLGYALVRVLQEDYEPIIEMARTLRITFPDGEPCVAALARPLPAGGGVGDKKYVLNNPLGGPAARFQSIADRIRAGESVDSAIRDHGVCFAAGVIAIADQIDAHLANCLVARGEAMELWSLGLRRIAAPAPQTESRE